MVYLGWVCLFVGYGWIGDYKELGVGGGFSWNLFLVDVLFLFCGWFFYDYFELLFFYFYGVGMDLFCFYDCEEYCFGEGIEIEGDFEKLGCF